MSAEDELLDPRALRRLRRLGGKGRELQTANIHNQDDHARPSDTSGGGNGVEAEDAAQNQTSNIHGQSGHDAPGSTTASQSAGTEEGGQDTGIECDPSVLSLNELIHCNGKTTGCRLVSIDNFCGKSHSLLFFLRLVFPGSSVWYTSSLPRGQQGRHRWTPGRTGVEASHAQSHRESHGQSDCEADAGAECRADPSEFMRAKSNDVLGRTFALPIEKWLPFIRSSF